MFDANKAFDTVEEVILKMVATVQHTAQGRYRGSSEDVNCTATTVSSSSARGAQ